MNLEEWCVSNHKEHILEEWNNEKNNDVKPCDVTSGSGKKVWWKCKINHVWQASVCNRVKGRNCPFCSNRRILIGGNDLLTINSSLASEWHPTKNGSLTPHDVTAGSNKKVWWKCKNNHEWEAVIVSRHNGNGCPYCAGQRVITGINDLATINPELAKQWNPYKNGNLTPENVTTMSTKVNVWWKCDKGHEWKSNIANRSKGNGCPYCAGKIAIKNETDLATLYPKLAKEWHFLKNGNLTPYDVTSGSDKKTWWKCDKGHEWQSSIVNRTKGNGCPICSSEMKTSFPEQAIYYYLKNSLDTEVQNRPIVFGKEIDIYIPAWKIGVEYDGKYYHSSKESSKREYNKDKYLMKLGVSIIRIKESEIDDIDFTNKIIFIRVNPDYNHINKAMKYLSLLLNQLIGINIEFYINIQNDRIKILALLIEGEKENSLAIKNPKASEFWNYKKNGTLTPNEVSYSSGKKLWWKCDKGHEWQALVSSINNGTRCPYCAGQLAIQGINDLNTLNPNLSKQWHISKNEDLTPKDVMNGTNKKVWWKCDKGHEWQASVNTRSRSSGCPYCSNKKVLKDYNDLLTINPSLANEWHNEKNGELVPSNITPGINKKVWWKCDKGHEWQATVYSRNKGRGCPYCSGRYAISNETDLLTLNPELAKQWHSTKNGNLKPSDVKINTDLKVWWKCEKGHEWQAEIHNRNSGTGCPYCKNKIILKGFNDFATLYQPYLKYWDYDINSLNPEDILGAPDIKAHWKCPVCGNKWIRDFRHMIRKDIIQRCQKCKSEIMDCAEKSRLET